MRPLHFTDEDFDNLVNEAILFDYDAKTTSQFFWSYYNRYKDYNFDFVNQLKKRIELLDPERFYKPQNEVTSLKFLSTLYEKYFKLSSKKDSNIIAGWENANDKIGIILEGFYKFKEYAGKGYFPQTPDMPEITLDQQIYILEKFGFFDDNNPLIKNQSKLSKLVSLLLKRSLHNTTIAIRNRYGYKKTNQKSIEGLNKILSELGLEKL